MDARLGWLARPAGGGGGRLLMASVDVPGAPAATYVEG
jgi:hypothetical protein